MKEDIEDKLQKLKALDGTVLDSFNSNVMWPSSPPSPTKEDAVDQARADAVKKGKPFTEPKQGDPDEFDDKAVDRYIDDLLEKLF
jgi:hypothetical protein